MSPQSKFYGLLYCVVAVLCVMSSASLSFNAPAYFSVNVLALFFIFRGLKIIFSKDDSYRQSIFSNVSREEKKISVVLWSNFLVLPLVAFVTIRIIYYFGPDPGSLGIALFGAIAGVSYLLITVAVYILLLNLNKIPNSRKAGEWCFLFLAIVTAVVLAISIATLPEKRMLDDERQVADSQYTFLSNITIGSPADILLDYYEKTTGFRKELSRLNNFTQLQQAFNRCDGVSEYFSLQNFEFYYIDEVLVLKVSPRPQNTADRSWEISIDYDNSMISFEEDGSMAVCNTIVDSQNLHDTMELHTMYTLRENGWNRTRLNPVTIKR